MDNSQILIQSNVPEERLYWIYDANVSWWFKHDDHFPSCRPDEHRGLCHNSSEFTFAFRAEPTPVELHDRFRNGLLVLTEKHTMHDIHYEVKLKLRAEWWCTWFSHTTFDIGQSDEEALMSFAQYVDWASQYDRDELRSRGEPSLCLMGAEDSWRWCGKPDDGGRGSSPPCRCDGCKKNGVLIISH